MCGNMELLQLTFFDAVLFGFVNGELPMKWLKFHPLQHNLYKHGPSEGQGSFSFNLKHFQSSFSVFIIFFTLQSALLWSAPFRSFKMLDASLANDRDRWGVISYSLSVVSLRSPVVCQSSGGLCIGYFCENVFTFNSEMGFISLG